MIQNTQQRIVNLWYILTLVFVACFFLPSFLGIDGMDGGFGLSFIAGFMVMVGIIVIVIYRARAKQLEKILSGEGKIALWRYSPNEWMRFVEADYKDEKQVKKQMFILVVVIAAIVGVIMTIVLQSLLVFMIIAGIMAIVAIPAFLVPIFRFRKLRSSEAEALIAENGVIVGKMFHVWVKLGARLDRVSLNTDEDPDIIEFKYSMPSRNGRQEQIARVPVPFGKLEEATGIVAHFNKKLNT